MYPLGGYPDHTKFYAFDYLIPGGTDYLYKANIWDISWTIILTNGARVHTDSTTGEPIPYDINPNSPDVTQTFSGKWRPYTSGNPFPPAGQKENSFSGGTAPGICQNVPPEGGQGGGYFNKLNYTDTSPSSSWPYNAKVTPNAVWNSFIYNYHGGAPPYQSVWQSGGLVGQQPDCDPPWVWDPEHTLPPANNHDASYIYFPHSKVETAGDDPYPINTTINYWYNSSVPSSPIQKNWEGWDFSIPPATPSVLGRYPPPALSTFNDDQQNKVQGWTWGGTGWNLVHKDPLLYISLFDTPAGPGTDLPGDGLYPNMGHPIDVNGVGEIIGNTPNSMLPLDSCAYFTDLSFTVGGPLFDYPGLKEGGWTPRPHNLDSMIWDPNNHHPSPFESVDSVAIQGSGPYSAYGMWSYPGNSTCNLEREISILTPGLCRTIPPEHYIL